VEPITKQVWERRGHGNTLAVSMVGRISELSKDEDLGMESEV
jgi:hypothetical protein